MSVTCYSVVKLLLGLSSACFDLRGDSRFGDPQGMQAILADIRAAEPKLLVIPYIHSAHREFVNGLAREQDQSSRRFAVCMLDDVSLPRIDNVRAAHTSQLLGSRVLHNLAGVEGDVLSVELSENARVSARAVERLLELECVPVNAGRKNLNDSTEAPQVHSMIFGAYTSYGLGVSVNGAKRHELLALLHSLASERPPQASPYATINVCVLFPGSHIRLHRDLRNRLGMSWLLAFGPYNGRAGRLWVESPQGIHPPPVGVIKPPDAPGDLKGIYLDPHMCWVGFDASAWHAVEPVEHTRCSMSCYIPIGVQHFGGKLWKTLRRQGFPAEALRELVSTDSVVHSHQGRCSKQSLNAWLVSALAHEASIHPQEIGTHVDEVTEWDALPEYYMCVHDTTSGQPLDATLVAAGCKQEMDFLKGLGAYEYSTVSECMERTGKPPVSVGWVYVNKGDSVSPNVRCRLVVKETRWRSTISDPSQTWSATPPYESLRFLCSLCMTPMEGEEEYVLQFIDITRAHPHCVMKRDLWIQLPHEDPRSKEPGVCGKLLRSLYGTRDAGQKFELLLQETMVGKMVHPRCVDTLHISA
eukprot:6466627-Amphidinium_carterae.2